ncbi:MAG: DUF2061 domain-containing protein [Armatimonadota bacterium]|nr:MAG: DUF2061 domain-containing protein [Armatimonadota bacterium]
MTEHRRRSVVKAVSWRILATITTMGVVYGFTGRLDLSLGVGAVEVVVKMLLYYAHERLWGRVTWGRPSHPLAALPVTKQLTSEDMDEIRRRLEELGYL